MRVSIVLALLGLGCSPPVGPTADDVMIFGCEELYDRGDEIECELLFDTRELRLWVPGGAPLVLFDGVMREPISVLERDGGRRLTVAVPHGARRLSVTRATTNGRPLVPWSAKLVWREGSAQFDELEPLFAAYADARDVDCQDLAAALLQHARADRRWRRAMLIATIGSACGIRQGDLAAIIRWHSEAEKIPAGPDDREADRANLVAGALIHEGDFHAALTVLEAGIEHAKRLGMTTIHAQLVSLYSLALIETGDFSAAIDAAREALDNEEHDPATTVALRDNLAWALIREAERLGLGAPAEAKQQLLSALASVEDPSHSVPLEYGSILRLNLAQLFLLQRELDAADEILDGVAFEADSLGPKFQAELRLLRAQVRTAAGEYDTARALLLTPGLEGSQFGDRQLELWTARGEVAEALGDLSAARSYYHRVHQNTLERVQGLAVTQGLQRFVFDRRRAAQRLVRLLAGPLHNPRAALTIARETAGTDARLLTHRGAIGDEQTHCLAASHAYLSARDSHDRELLENWGLPGEQRRQALLRSERAAQAHADTLLNAAEHRRDSPLRAVRQGELALLYFPLDADRLLAFAVTHVDVAVASIDARSLPSLREAPLDAVTLASWSDALLGPFAQEIANTRQIRILPSLGLQVLPFHALPWRGRPLLAHAAVEYSLDLPPRNAARRDIRQALVVGDPAGDLADARIEAEAVGARLASRGIGVTTLIGHAANGPAVRAALSSVDHLHYAGHSATAGERGWESVLHLSESTTLTIPDILALEQVPRTVSLLSCSAGNAPPEPRGQGMTLAAAFLIAGSETVIASSIALRSDDAAVVASELYPAEATADLPALYRSTLLRRVEDLAPSTWQALRLWVP